ncbi:MAG: hypothetical protein AB1649_01495 [Chloroflexota bacterium]
MTDKPTVIRFVAEIVQVKTKADHGTRLTLDLPESESRNLSKLIEAYQRGALLEVAAVPVDPKGE